jgi:hypothetical protein
MGTWVFEEEVPQIGQYVISRDLTCTTDVLLRLGPWRRDGHRQRQVVVTTTGMVRFDYRAGR